MALTGTQVVRKARLSVVTPPAVEPVTLTEAKLHLRVDGTDEDTWVQRAIEAARRGAEAYTRRALITQQLRMTFDVLEGDDVTLWRPPLVSVQSVAGVNEDGTLSTMAASDYYAVTDGAPGRVVRKTGASWPTPTRQSAAFRIDYTAGYGDDPGDVPELAVQAILQAVGDWYENRGTHDPMGRELSAAACYMLSPLRVFY